MTARVSVCIPAYNSEKYIRKTIESIRVQTFEDWELIIVDDCSTDNTYKIIKKYESMDSRIHAYKNEENLGMSGNWNKCLSLCSGEYMKLCCADDMLSKNALLKEVAALDENPEAVLACSDTKLKDVNGKNKGFYRRYRKHGLVSGRLVVKKGFFSQDYFGAPQANLFRRSVYEKVGGFDTNYTYILDYDFFVSIAMLGDIFIIHEPLNMFCVRNDSNTGHVMGGDKEKLAIYLKEHYYLYNKQKQALGLSKMDIKRCMIMRRFRCFAGSMYLKTALRDERMPYGQNSGASSLL